MKKAFLTLGCVMLVFGVGSESYADLGDTGADLIYTPVAPCRIIDTREPGAGGPIAGGGTRSFWVVGTTGFGSQGGHTGGCGIPEDATSVMINFVAVGATAVSHMRAWPYGGTMPLASIINFGPGLNIANGLIQPICNPAEATCLFDLSIYAASPVQVVADVTGYFRRFPTEQLPAAPLPSGSLPNALDGTSSAGSSANYSRGDHKHGIAPGAITNTMIGTGAVSTAKIGDGQVTNAKITGPIDASKIDPLITRDSEVMTIVKNNDGSGSGVDADLLDGFHASGFSLTSHDHNAAYVNVNGDSMSGTASGALLSVTNSGTADMGIGVVGSGETGVKGISTGDFGLVTSHVAGVFGQFGSFSTWYSPGNAGVRGDSRDYTGVLGTTLSYHGVKGCASGTSGYGGYFFNAGGGGTDRGVGVAGFSGSGGSADTHPGGYFLKAGGEFAGVNGVIGAVSSDGVGAGVIGVARSEDSSIGIYGYKLNGGNYAGYFYGNVHVLGTLSTSGTKPFKIDHPLDPANKYLMHYAIESPTVQNMYNGTILLDAYGEAIVQLPDYFEAVNTEEFTYTLTPIGASMPGLHVAEEVQNNQFKISGGLGGKKVSWVLIAQRNDPWVKNNPAKDVVDKPKEEIGTYLYPQGHGQPESLSMTSVRMQRQTKP